MCILTFESTHAVMKAEALFRARNLSYQLLPTPRSLSADCGVSISISNDSAETASEIVATAGIMMELYRDVPE